VRQPRDDERYPRGTAYHEAGHAVVAWSFGLQVGTISVLADDASGSTQIAPAGHLGLVEQIAVCAAGYTAEKTFDYPTHYCAAIAPVIASSPTGPPAGYVVFPRSHFGEKR
jgi:hypothetical protein